MTIPYLFIMLATSVFTVKHVGFAPLPFVWIGMSMIFVGLNIHLKGKKDK